jgi:hypothetical protein
MRRLVAAYLAAIVGANLLLAVYGPPAAIANALLLVALDLVARDRLHAAWAGRRLWPRMLALIAGGGLLSYALSWLTPAPPDVVGRIALASCAAFSAAGLADAAVFQRLAGRGWLARSNGSNVAGATVDSLVFGALVGLPWFVVALQALAKAVGGALWAWLLRPRAALGEARRGG